MKRSFVIALALSCSVIGFAQQIQTLDEALRASTGYLKNRIPTGSKVIVLNFISKWSDLTDYIIEELTGYIVNEGTLTVVDRRNLEAIRQEMDFQLSGEVSDETAQSIGQKLGAQTIISGSISAIGDTYRLRIRAIAVETAQIQGLQNVDVYPDRRLAALTGTAFPGSIPPNINTMPAQIHNYISFAEWKAFADSKTSSFAQCNVQREVIDGRAVEVLAMTMKLASNGWGVISSPRNTALTQTAKTANGIRFKVYGDGKPWCLGVETTDTDSDGCRHQLRFSTKKGKVMELDIPYSKLRQLSWGKKKSFNKANIHGFLFLRDVYEDGTAESTIKVFDFELY
ncbi:MAG: CIA30 family protein [Treponema sp.]|jgi:TolB-like protein|nr:CIA30 family protein [Treponema sp.]